MVTTTIDAARAFADQFARDGSKAVTLCSDVTLFLNGAPEDFKAGALAFYSRFIAECGSAVSFVRNGDKARFKKRPKNLETLLASWFDGGGPLKGSYSLQLEGGERMDEPSDHAFHFSWILGQAYIRAIFPAEYLIDSAAQFSALALELADGLDFRCGCAGPAVNIQAYYSSTNEGGAFSRIGERFPGIDLGKPLYWTDLTVAGIKTVNWLTFLGREHLARAAAHVGGEQKLAAELGANVAVTRLPHGVMIQAGAAPGFGDTTKGETLPEYRQVARALRGLKIPPEVLRNYDGIGGTESTRKWLNRFD